MKPEETNEPEADDESQSSRRSRDPETRVIDAMLRTLDELESNNARRRVMTYLLSRFQESTGGPST